MPFSFKPQQAPQVPGQSPVPATAMPSASVRPPAPSNIGSFQKALFTIFGIAVLIAVVLFAYNWFLGSRVEAKKQVIDEYDRKLSGFPLEAMRETSNRIKFINELLKNHASVNAGFRILEDSIEHPITYTNFDLRYDESKKNYNLQLNASSPDYRTVVQQVETLKRKPYSNYLSNVSVTSLQPDETGRITFSTKMNIAIAGVLPDELMLNEPTAQPTDGSATSTLNGASSSTEESI